MLTKQIRRLNLQNKKAFITPAQRGYFSFVDRVKEAVHKPMKHLKSFAEPDGINYESQLPDGYRLHGNTAAHFSASMSNNALELNQWHEMETTVHSQFGTVDNPVLIFTSDSSWRIVICMGPGIEDDSHAHEKMYYFVREGPMHRCHICGQCFKIVRLKHESSDLNDYYSSMFAAINHFEVQEEDNHVNLMNVFGDRPQAALQTLPSMNVYVHVNNDEADRVMVDPAYKLERIQEVNEKTYAMQEAFRVVQDQVKDNMYYKKIPYGKDMYESWYNIEKSIMKFDRIFNKVEKFEARALTDPVNHERREKRMLEQKRKRWTQNYTYFFGELTEEEQMYRDYFKTDIEEDPEDEYIDGLADDIHLAQRGDFNPKLFDFIDYTATWDQHENYDDIVEQKIFKFKYRQFADSFEEYERRQSRMIDRFMDRAKTRDPILEQSLYDLFESDARDFSLAKLATDSENFRLVAMEETRPHREYMVNESVQQYKDYFESDDEEQQFFEYLENFSNRDKLRLMEIFEDFTVDKSDRKEFVSIQKREYNPELSVVSNLLLDLVDFKDRVRPLSKDIAMLEQTAKYEKQNVDQMLQEKADFDIMLEDSRARVSGVSTKAKKAGLPEQSDGYSSMDLPEPKQKTTESEHSEEDAAVPEHDQEKKE